MLFVVANPEGLDMVSGNWHGAGSAVAAGDELAALGASADSGAAEAANTITAEGGGRR